MGREIEYTERIFMSTINPFTVAVYMIASFLFLFSESRNLLNPLIIIYRENFALS